MPPSLVHRWVELIGAETDPHGLRHDRGHRHSPRSTGDEWLAAPGQRRPRLPRHRGPDPRRRAATTCPAGEIGDIYLRSPGYGGSTYLGEAPQLAHDRRRLLTVGDMGYLDEDGYLYLVDRRVDLIITGGANVFPAEVETALIDHPQDRRRGGRSASRTPSGAGACTPSSSRPTPPTRRRPTRSTAYAKSRLAAYKVPKIDRARRRHPPQRGHEGQPRPPGRRTRGWRLDSAQFRSGRGWSVHQSAVVMWSRSRGSPYQRGITVSGAMWMPASTVAMEDAASEYRPFDGATG